MRTIRRTSTLGAVEDFKRNVEPTLSDREAAYPVHAAVFNIYTELVEENCLVGWRIKEIQP